MDKSKGFTIIELLTVISIIGVLVAVVLINIDSVRKKAKDASIKMEMDYLVMSGLRYYMENFNYDEFELDPESKNIFANIDSDHVNYHYDKNASAWAVCSQLNSDTNNAWCVDNTGSRALISLSSCDDKIISCANPIRMSSVFMTAIIDDNNGNDNNKDKDKDKGK